MASSAFHFLFHRLGPPVSICIHPLFSPRSCLSVRIEVCNISPSVCLFMSVSVYVLGLHRCSAQSDGKRRGSFQLALISNFCLAGEREYAEETPWTVWLRGNFLLTEWPAQRRRRGGGGAESSAPPGSLFTPARRSPGQRHRHRGHTSTSMTLDFNLYPPRSTEQEISPPWVLGVAYLEEKIRNVWWELRARPPVPRATSCVSFAHLWGCENGQPISTCHFGGSALAGQSQNPEPRLASWMGTFHKAGSNNGLYFTSCTSTPRKTTCTGCS